MISIENLTKYYGKHLAVDNISFSVGKGEIVGFLGANGAGKSTTMRMITGYLMPTSGQAYVGEYNIAEKPICAKQLLGYLPENVPLYTDMTIRNYLIFAAGIRGLDKKKARQRVDEIAVQCGLENYIDTHIKKLSKGYKQRVGIAQAIIHDPSVLILDEPTIGIDPIQLAQVRKLITELGKDRTILLSTHDLSEASMICERVVIIREGKIVAKDSIENLSAIVSKSMGFRLKVQGPAEKVAQALASIDTINNVREEDDAFIVEYNIGSVPQQEIISVLLENNWALLSMEEIEMSLEDIFLNLAAGKDE